MSAGPTWVCDVADADREPAPGWFEVVDPGLLALVEDLGRPGYAHLGVSASGAVDVPSLLRANRLVGNRRSAAAVELTLGRAAMCFPAGATVAVTGAPAEVTVGGRPAAFGAPLEVAPGEEVRVGRPPAGVRCYLAVRGGVAVPPVLGSRSRDTLAGLGPAELHRGDRVPIGSDMDSQPVVLPSVGFEPEPVLRVNPGPRQDWLVDAALDALFSAPYRVTPQSDRVGMRLSGPPLHHRRAGELPPEGVVTGALQVPPDGQPVLFLADHPLTGGYPVIAVVASADVALAAQVRPGGLLRFTPADDDSYCSALSSR
jgi:biotin-dependent carboxylase-like uncharacterized protein